MNQEENLNRIITVPNLLSFFRLCLIPVIIWSYCVKKNPLLAGEILLLSGITDLADGYIARSFKVRYIVFGLLGVMALAALVFMRFGGFGTGENVNPEEFLAYAEPVENIKQMEKIMVLGRLPLKVTTAFASR